MASLDTAFKSASLNSMLQIILRFSSFVMNGVILRYIHAEILGVVNLRLTLLHNTVLFLSREAIRKACLTQSNETRLWTHILNIAWVPIPLGILISSVLGMIWLSPFIEQPKVAEYGYGVLVFGLTAVIELSAEPLWLMGQAFEHVILKVAAEGIPQMIKCAIIVIGVVYGTYSGLTIFLIAQLVYSLLYVFIYYCYFHYEFMTCRHHKMPVGHLFGFLPRREVGAWFGPYLSSLTWTFFKQSFLKQMLTDGEKYVMTVFGVLTFSEQGVYDIINNLGSLVARFVFLPIEESFYIYFATTLYRGVPLEKQPIKAVAVMRNALSMIIKMVLVIGIVMLVFGYSYSHLALDIYGGSLLLDGGGVFLLRWYCVYVLIIAVNGVTECFVLAVMSEDQINKYNRYLVAFSVTFLVASLFLTWLFGSVGFILANCINMSTRIIHSLHFIHYFFIASPYRPLLSALPSVRTLAAFVVVFFLAALSEKLFCCGFGWSFRFLHVIIGVILLLAVGVVVGLNEPDLVEFIAVRLPKNSFTNKFFSKVEVRRFYKKKM